MFCSLLPKYKFHIDLGSLFRTWLLQEILQWDRFMIYIRGVKHNTQGWNWPIQGFYVAPKPLAQDREQEATGGGGSKNHSSCGFSMVGHLCLQYSRRNPLFQGQPFQLACSSKDAVQDDQGDQHLHMGGFSIGACWWPALPPYSYPLPCHTCILSHGRHCFKPATEHGTQQPGLLLHGPSSGLQCRWLLPHGGCVLQSAVILGGTSTTCFALCTWCPLPFQLTGICHFMRLARLGDHLWFELPALPCNGLPGSHGWRQSLPLGQFRLGLAWAPVYT